MLTVGAAVVELGIPVACAWRWARHPASRSGLAVVLGAVTPWLVFYLWATIASMTTPGAESRWAAAAMWEMTFVPYLATLGIAAVLAQAPWPRSLPWRAVAGLIFLPAVALVVVAVTRWKA